MAVLVDEALVTTSTFRLHKVAAFYFAHLSLRLSIFFFFIIKFDSHFLSARQLLDFGSSLPAIYVKTFQFLIDPSFVVILIAFCLTCTLQARKST